MNYLLYRDLENLKERLQEVDSALAILKQVGFPEGYVVNLLRSEQKKLQETIADEESTL